VTGRHSDRLGQFGGERFTAWYEQGPTV